MKKALVYRDDGTGNLYLCDVIDFKGEPWLVLSWLKPPAGEPRKPERIVRLGAFQHQKVLSGQPYQYCLQSALPTSLFDGGHLPKWLDSEVIDHPVVLDQIGTA